MRGYTLPAKKRAKVQQLLQIRKKKCKKFAFFCENGIKVGVECDKVPLWLF